LRKWAANHSRIPVCGVPPFLFVRCQQFSFSLTKRTKLSLHHAR
jgi:hypothetical protein